MGRGDGADELRVGELKEICEFARRQELASWPCEIRAFRRSRDLDQVEWSWRLPSWDGDELEIGELREEVRISAEVRDYLKGVVS